MNRALRVIGILGIIAVVVFALWMARTRSARRSNQESLSDTIHSAITNPVVFAKSRFTGGVGAILVADPAVTGRFKITHLGSNQNHPPWWAVM